MENTESVLATMMYRELSLKNRPGHILIRNVMRTYDVRGEFIPATKSERCLIRMSYFGIDLPVFEKPVRVEVKWFGVHHWVMQNRPERYQ